MFYGGYQTNRLLLVLGFALAISGCGGGGFNAANIDNTNPINPVIPGLVNPLNPVDPGTSDDSTPSSDSVFTVLVNLLPDITAAYSKVEMELFIGTVSGAHDTVSARQGGDLVLHFTDSSGRVYTRAFTSGGTTAMDVELNYWFRSSSGELLWRGVFEGPSGALIVVVDGVYSDGDGGDPFDLMQGSVWFRPWQTVADTGVNSQTCRTDSSGRIDCKNPSGPISRCWRVSLGPYDCRFSVSNDGKTVNSIGNRYNSQKYIKIGEFIDLSKEDTFKTSYL